MSLPILPTERAYFLAVLRPAIAHLARNLATPLAGLADLYAKHPERRDLITYVGGHAERVRHDLARLVAAERRLVEAA